ncbi:hypothetical protein B0H13DRAFT_2655319, partial [Mycena leptocephala]
VSSGPSLPFIHTCALATCTVHSGFLYCISLGFRQILPGPCPGAYISHPCFTGTPTLSRPDSRQHSTRIFRALRVSILYYDYYSPQDADHVLNNLKVLPVYIESILVWQSVPP